MFIAALFIIARFLETTQMFLSRWIDNLWYFPPYKGILFSSKMEWYTNTYNHTLVPQRHHAQWKQPAPNSHKPCTSIQSRSDGEHVSGCQRLGARQELTIGEHERIGGSNLHLDWDDIFLGLCICQIPRNFSLEWLNSITYKLYLNSFN